MVFVTAQPDEPFFIWQLTLLINNLRDLSVQRKNIQIIVSFDPFFGINRSFKNFIREYRPFASFYLYPDYRTDKIYQPSVRPHILKQHFAKFPSLSSKTIFYIDSDVLFNRVPKVNYSDDICYVSNTKKYIDSTYIIKNGGENLLDKMAKVVGLPSTKVRANDKSAGGAQYLLKRIDHYFWEKVEKDCVKIYVTILQHNLLGTGQKLDIEALRAREKTLGSMAWCSDMWAVLWNLWYINKMVKIHKELDFVWPSSPITQWNKKAILHYTGTSQKKSGVFRKGNYKWFAPWFDQSLSNISRNNCSWIIYQGIRKVKETLESKRKKLKICLVIYNHKQTGLKRARDGSLLKNIFLKEYDCKVIFGTKREDKIFLKQDGTSHLNSHISETEYIILQPEEYLINISNYARYFQALKNSNYSKLILTISTCRVVDALHRKTLSLYPDFGIIASNKNKFFKQKADKEIIFLKKAQIKSTNKGRYYVSLDESNDSTTLKKIHLSNAYFIPNE